MTRLHRELLADLTDQIVGGQLAPGTRLPRELDLTVEYDVSRGIVREGLRALEERGLIEVKHGRGATVRDPGDWNVLDPDVAIAFGKSGGGHLPADALACLPFLETPASGEAATAATAADLDAMRRELEAMRDAGENSARHRDARIGFHRILLRTARNPMLTAIGERLHQTIPDVASDAHASDLSAHQRIYDAIERHDPSAARDAMDAYLSGLGARLGDVKARRR